MYTRVKKLDINPASIAVKQVDIGSAFITVKKVYVCLNFIRVKKGGYPTTEGASSNPAGEHILLIKISQVFRPIVVIHTV